MEAITISRPPVSTRTEALVYDGKKQTFIGIPTFVGTGAWGRVAERFGPRMSEWICATIMFLWGGVLLLPAATFDIDTFQYFAAIFGSENRLGTLMLLIGFMRLSGLIVNGARQQVTPAIRTISALVAFWVWLGITTCFALSGVVSTWLAIYPVLAITEIANMYRASVDAGKPYRR